MGQARDEAGNVWETDAQGNPVRLISQATGSMTIGTPDPAARYKGPRAAVDLQGAQAGNVGKGLDNKITAATMNAHIRTANANASKAESEAKSAEAKAAAEPLPEVTKATRDLGLDEVLRAITNARANTSGWSTGTPGQFLHGWGGTQARDLGGDLSTIGSALTVDKLKEMKAQSQTGASGMGALSEKEGALLRDSVASLDQFQSQDKVRQSLDAIELHYRRLRAIQDGQNPDDPQVQQHYGLAGGLDKLGGPSTGGQAGGPGGNASGPGTPPNGGGDPQTIATGPTRREHSDRLSSQIDTMMNAGASIDQINKAMRQGGYPPIRPEEYAAARSWMAQNPGKRYTGGSADREVPMTLLERVAGSPGGAFMANLANDFTAGTAVALAGDRGRGAQAAMQQVYPTASGLGSFVGGVGGAMASELAAARMLGSGLRAGGWAARGGDALYGGAQGFNSAEDGQGLKGAALGAALGMGGGYLGEKGGKYLGGAIKGVTDPSVQYLRQVGIPMTIGQALSRSGTVGRAIKGTEDAMTSIPMVGNVIDARRLEGLDAFNRAAFRRAGEPIGFAPTRTGMGGIADLNAAKSQAYTNALGGRGIDVSDPTFVQDLGTTLGQARAIPDVNGAQGAAMQALQHRIGGAVDPNDIISGRNFQEAYRGLARTSRERANGDYGHEIGQVMRSGQDALAGALERQNPGAFDQFLAANQANRRLSVLADAVNAAQNQESRLFTPAQLGRADANNATKLTSRIAAMSGDNPFTDLAEAGQAVLPSKLPDSGTFKRLLIGSGVTGMFGGAGAGASAATGHDAKEGAGYGTGAGLLAALALTGGGSKVVQRAAMAALLDRPDLARRIGTHIQNNADLGGAIGTGLGIPILLSSGQ